MTDESIKTYNHAHTHRSGKLNSWVQLLKDQTKWKYCIRSRYSLIDCDSIPKLFVTYCLHEHQSTETMGSTESKPSIRRNDSSTSPFGRLSYPSPRYHENSPGCIEDFSRLRQMNRKAQSGLIGFETRRLQGKKDFSDRRR